MRKMLDVMSALQWKLLSERSYDVYGPEWVAVLTFVLISMGRGPKDTGLLSLPESREMI